MRTNEFVTGLGASGPAGLLVIALALAGMTYNLYAVLVPQRRFWPLAVLACGGPFLLASVFAYCRIHAAYDAFDNHNFRMHLEAVAVSRTVLLSVAVLSGLAGVCGGWAIVRNRKLLRVDPAPY